MLPLKKRYDNAQILPKDCQQKSRQDDASIYYDNWTLIFSIKKNIWITPIENSCQRI
jgi:hypothetical protein